MCWCNLDYNIVSEVLYIEYCEYIFWRVSGTASRGCDILREIDSSRHQGDRMDDARGHTLIYDWNEVGEQPKFPERVMIADETLRDGLQSPSVLHPAIEDKIRLLHLMHELGIDVVNLGLPGAGDRFKNDATMLAREIVDQKMNMQAQGAGRTLEVDTIPIIEVSQQSGLPVEVCLFLGASHIRQYAEGWDLDKLLRLTESAIAYAVKHDLPVMFITEDTTRSHPEHLRKLYTVAMRAGASRICVADTVGHATPSGVRSLIAFLRTVVNEVNPDVGIDWHGHRDRGMDILNSIAALEAGADRIHACALGVGERCGNTSMELLLVNLNLMGIANRDLTRLPQYCQLVSEICGVTIPHNYPIVGADAFRTATGVHAAAVIKALNMNDEWLADRVYSGVPASMIGRAQGIEIGPMSGLNNVRFWLRQRGIEEQPLFVEKIFAVAKRSNRTLQEAEVLRMIDLMRERVAQGQDVDEGDLERIMDDE